MFTVRRSAFHVCDIRDTIPAATQSVLANGIIKINLLVVDFRGAHTHRHFGPGGRPDLPELFNWWDPAELRVLGDPEPSDGYPISRFELGPSVNFDKKENKTGGWDSWEDSFAFLPWTRLTHVTLVNATSDSLAFLLRLGPESPLPNVVFDLSRQFKAIGPDNETRWAKNGTPLSEPARTGDKLVSDCLLQVQYALSSDVSPSAGSGPPTFADLQTPATLGSVTVLLASDAQVAKADDLLRWHSQTNFEARSKPAILAMVRHDDDDE